MDEDLDLYDFFEEPKISGKFFSFRENGWHIIMDRTWNFREYLYTQKMSDSTVRTYCSGVSDFYEWTQLQYNLPPRNLYREHVLKFRDYLKGSGIQPRTINHKLSSLKKYNEYGCFCITPPKGIARKSLIN